MLSEESSATPQVALLLTDVGACIAVVDTLLVVAFADTLILLTTSGEGESWV